MFQWEPCYQWQPEWLKPISWPRSVVWCRDGKNAFFHGLLCSSNLWWTEESEKVQRTFKEISLVLNSFCIKMCELTCLLVNFLIRLNNRAKAVEHQCSQFRGAALWWFIIIQWVIGQNKPAFLELERCALPTGLHLFMQPTWKIYNQESMRRLCLCVF